LVGDDDALVVLVVETLEDVDVTLMGLLIVTSA